MFSHFNNLFAAKESSKNKITFLGRGTYGCVIRPGIKSNNQVDENAETITKIFYNKNAYKKELDEYSVIKIFDPDNKFTVKLLANSEMDNEMPIINIGILREQCEELFNYKQQSIYQIEYEYGGIDLKVLFRIKHKNILRNLNLHHFFKEFANIFYGVNEMNKSGYTHFDIKHDNIVFNPTTYKFSLIDFGLLETTSDIFDTSHLKTDFNFRPPELLIVSYIYINKKVKKDVLLSAINRFKNFERIYFIQNDEIRELFIYYFITIYKTNLIKNNIIFNILLKMFAKINQVHAADILSDLQMTKNTYVNSNIDEACHLIKIESDNIRQKYDIYMLGIALLYIIIEMFIQNNINLHSIKIETIEKILILILKMIEPNPCLRISINDAYNEYLAIFSD